jgi:hypothetical protein
MSKASKALESVRPSVKFSMTFGGDKSKPGVSKISVLSPKTMEVLKEMRKKVLKKGA